MNSLPFLTDGTHPTWIIKRHPIQNDDTTNSTESKLEISKSVRIENWIIANVKRVEANRKLSQQQVPYKLSAASTTFKETIKEYERIIGMLQQQVQNASSCNENAAKMMVKHGISSLSDKTPEKSMQAAKEQQEQVKTRTILDLEYLKYRNGSDERKSFKRIAQVHRRKNQCDGHIREGVVTNEQRSSHNRGSYQYSVKQFVTTSKSASEVILKQILMEKTVENSNTTEELPLQKTYDTANLALNMKQASIRTLLSYTEREEKDDHDLSEEECQPDWVTSSFRLGSIRRRKNEKNVAMQRIQKEIELEKQRHSDMIKMRQNDKRT